MNNMTITAFGSACAALVVAALFIFVPAVDAAETVHMPVRGDTQDAAAESAPQGAGKRPAVQPDPIGKSARPDVAPGRDKSRATRSRSRARDGAPEPEPATTGIEHEDIGSAARASDETAKKPRKGLTAPGSNLKDKLATEDDQADSTTGDSSATDRARAAEKGEPNRR